MGGNFTSILRATFRLLIRNRPTLFGFSFAAFSVLTLASLSLLEITGILHSPYLGILTFLIMPLFMLFGMLLFALGLVRKPSKPYLTFDFAPDSPHDILHLNFSSPRTRQAFGMVGFLSGVNLFVFGITSYHGVVYMDSSEFCGKVCHTVMEPQFTAYQDSPHSHVECVHCHVGRGAEAFVEAKVAGLRQVYGVLFDSYERPIPPPHQSLRPARETCENCHAPAGAFSGDEVRVFSHFSDDEQTSPQQTVLVMHMGNESAPNGIHSWHLAPGRQVTYESLDEAHQQIVKVSVKEEDGSVRVYKSKALAPRLDGAASPMARTMDCLDCHSRPSHRFQMPEDAVDRALGTGKLDRRLPYVRRIAIEALSQTKGKDGDLERIAQHMVSYYKKSDPGLYETHQEQIAEAVEAVQALYRRNVFPKMNVTWGTYIDNGGHVHSAGCFRCHNDALVSNDGKTISQDCTVCHGVLALEESNPKILDDLGIARDAQAEAVAKSLQ